jgi:N-acyl-D-aspartate/D-glutamate deacylase
VDVGVQDGRIAEIGTVTDAAHETIDAACKIVAPGFVDIHTHYDAQVFWDHKLSPSSFHGITTVIGGNCGFSIAPLTGKPDDSTYLLRMLARVEGIPIDSLQQGVPWDWTSFDEYLDRLDGKLALNAGFMVGHSALRRAVMGARAVGEKATQVDIAQMQDLLRRSLRAGGLGFSSTISSTHNDGDGRPVPSRYASEDEILALAGVCREFPGTSIEFLPSVISFGEEQMDLMTRLSLASERPVNWNMIAPNSADPELLKRQLSVGDYAEARGGRVVGLVAGMPITIRLNLAAGIVLDALPGWAEIFELSIPKRMEAFRDPAVRDRLERLAGSDAAGGLRDFAKWENYQIVEVFSAANKPLEGQTVRDIAEQQGKRPFDTLLDICLADDLRTSFAPPAIGADDESWRLRVETWKDWRSVIGASDAGAHLDMIESFAFSTSVLGTAVRERGLLTLEEAVHQLTQVPASLIGLTDRGILRAGSWADLVIFDPDRIGRGPLHTRFDLPGGAGRLYADAIGIHHVIVNGNPIIRDGQQTGAEPGRILRSGRDTHTASLAKTSAH